LGEGNLLFPVGARLLSLVKAKFLFLVKVNFSFTVKVNVNCFVRGKVMFFSSLKAKFSLFLFLMKGKFLFLMKGKFLFFVKVKTKLQTAPSTQHLAPGWGSMLWSLAKAGGLPALFTGAGLRSVRTGTAYGIMMASYEIAKNDMRHYFNAPSLLPVPQRWFEGNP
jgi:hypothetical protein